MKVSEVRCKVESMYVHHFKNHSANAGGILLMFLVSCLILTFFLSAVGSLAVATSAEICFKDTEEEDDAGGINLDKAKERLQEEDKFGQRRI